MTFDDNIAYQETAQDIRLQPEKYLNTEAETKAIVWPDIPIGSWWYTNKHTIYDWGYFTNNITCSSTFNKIMGYLNVYNKNTGKLVATTTGFVVPGKAGISMQVV